MICKEKQIFLAQRSQNESSALDFTLCAAGWKIRCLKFKARTIKKIIAYKTRKEHQIGIEFYAYLQNGIFRNQGIWETTHRCQACDALCIQQ